MENSKKNRGGLAVALALLLPPALAAALAWYYDTFVHWQPRVYPFAVAAVLFGIAALTLLVLRLRGETRAKTLLWKTLLSTVVFALALLFVSYIINNVIGHEGMARQAANVAVPLAAAQVLVLCALLVMALQGRAGRGDKALAAVAAGMAVLLAAAGVFGFILPNYLQGSFQAAIPSGLNEGRFAPMETIETADFYVSPEGSDENPGTREEPFATIEAARDSARALSKTGKVIGLLPGEYNIRSIQFGELDRDLTICAMGGEAVLNGGMRLDPNDFFDPGLDVIKRFSPEAREHIVVIDLTALGLTAEDWGKLYSFGAFTTASKYDDGVGPLPCELFVGGRRCVTARYPNGEEWLRIGKVIDNGDSGETYENGTLVNENWPDMRNPRGATFEMDKTTAARTNRWATLEDVWMFGCFKWDWADMSTPVKGMDNAAGTVTTEYASNYGYAQNGSYYFYNVLEELDEPGEWYLDRGAGILYLWPPEGNFADARIDLSLSTETLITGEGLEDFRLIGLTLQGTRGDGVNLSGNNITVDHCVIRSLAGSAMRLDGYNNTASNNEVYRVGKSGITISGGDAETLTPGGSKAVNNLVHDWPEVVMTYQGGVNVYGTGNLAAHNEIYNSPHSAMFFGGNNNVIEYNHIHDVCLLTHDAGAIYNGRSWCSAYGTVIRYNAIYNLGGGDFKPCGIYLDDGLSGVAVEQNLLVNVPGTAIAISGRDLQVTGNVVVNTGRPVNYDDRTRISALGTSSWYFHAVEDGPQWQELWASPYQTEIWKAAFPRLAAVSSDFADIEDPAFAANPALSEITGNVFVGNKPGYSDSVLRFNTLEPNAQYSLTRGRSYWELPGYEAIPVGLIGRMEELP